MPDNPNRTVYNGKIKVQLHPTEEGIARNPWESYRYAKDILKGPFPAGERVLAKNPYYAFEYAKTIKGRFELGEKAIANSEFAEKYIKKFDKTGELGLKARLDELVDPNRQPIVRPARNRYNVIRERLLFPVDEFASTAAVDFYYSHIKRQKKKKKPVKKDWQKYGF